MTTFHGGNMKSILVYSIHHTGTWFTIDFLASIYPEDRVKKRAFGEFYSEPHRRTLHNLPTLDIPDHDMCVMQAHRRGSGATMSKSLKQHKPCIPVVIPMRDPLLSLCTRIWRRPKGFEEYLKLSKKSRQQYTLDHMAKFSDILKIPEENRFLFPIDIQELRPSLYSGLFDYCGLTKTQDSDKYFESWAPVNVTTKEWFQEWKNKGRVANKVSDIIKQSILAGSSEVVKDILDVEFNFIYKMDGFKKRLANIGYSDLVWW